jgi:hypothetical protein
MRLVPDLFRGVVGCAAVSLLVASALAVPGPIGTAAAHASLGAARQTASARPAAQVPVSDDVPSMDNDSFSTPPPPLPAGWPVGAKDAQFRGAACEEAYSVESARRKGEPGDDALPTLVTIAAGLPSPHIAVRRLPFLSRRDVLKALFVTADGGTYEVRLKLNEDGAKKVQEYTAENQEKCIALVAGGKILWHPTLAAPVTDDEFVLSGNFTISEAEAIAKLFND